MNLRSLTLPDASMAPMPATSTKNEARRQAPQLSAVCWSAIFAGAAGATALSLILVVLGVGLGFSSVSPWSGQGIGAAAFGVSTIVWLALTQLAAAGMGGYLAGRLRLRWHNTDTDEVYFRDTAHGFLAWAVATMLTVVLLTSVVGSVVDGAGRVAATAAAGAGAAATELAPKLEATSTANQPTNSLTAGGPGYMVDALFRAESNDAAPVAPESAAEVARIFANAMVAQALPADDARHAGRLVAQRTGLSQDVAQARVTDTFARMQAKTQELATAARQAADKARSAAAHASLWWFVSLLAGAFVASLAATYGGRRRDLF